jgi:major membrane immunogen (membrane-anchored lipoprotein)
VVVDSAVIADSMSRASQRYQQRFADSYATQVVGRPLAEIETVVVAGATASSLGFQDALAQIKDEARR